MYRLPFCLTDSASERGSAVAGDKLPNAAIGLVAEVVFHFTGVLSGSFGGDPQQREKRGNGLVAVIDAAGDGQSAFV